MWLRVDGFSRRLLGAVLLSLRLVVESGGADGELDAIGADGEPLSTSRAPTIA